MKKLLVIALTLALGSNAWGAKRSREIAEVQTRLAQARNAYLANNIDEAARILENDVFEGEVALENPDFAVLSNVIALRRNTPAFGDTESQVVATIEGNISNAQDPAIRNAGFNALQAYYQQRLAELRRISGQPGSESAKKPRKQ